MNAAEQQEVSWVIEVDKTSTPDIPWERPASGGADEDILGENLRDFLEPVLAALLYVIFICEMQWLMSA
jgi:hypothetical protein